MFKVTFGKKWAAMLMQAMQTTGKGYRRHSLRNTGNDKDRRDDKLEAPKQSKHFRAYGQRYHSPDAKRAEKSAA